MATVLPASELPRTLSLSSFATSALDAAPFRTSFENSAGVRSLMDMRWRGFAELEEYALLQGQRAAAILAVRNMLSVMRRDKQPVVHG